MTTGVTLASRRNSASTKLQGQEVLSLQDFPCCSTLRVLGDAIARTLPYAQLPMDAPTSIYSSQVSCHNLPFQETRLVNSRLLHTPWGSLAKAVPERTTLSGWGVPQRVPSSVSSRILRSDVVSCAQTSRTPKVKMTMRKECWAISPD